MSIPKLQLVPQPRPQAEIIAHAPATLDSAKTILVNRKQLSEAREGAHHISSALHNAENLSDLNISELADLCRRIYHAIEVLSAMLNVTPEVAA